MNTLLQNLISELEKSKENGTVVVHANKETCEMIMDDIQATYAAVDLSHFRESKTFPFGADSITLKFEYNPYITPIHFRLIPEKFFREQSYLSSRDLGLIYTSENDLIGDDRQDCINFCIANAIAFIPVNERIFVHDIYTNQPYKYVFRKNGVTEEAIQEAGEIALRILENKINQMCNYYKTVPPTWHN